MPSTYVTYIALLSLIMRLFNRVYIFALCAKCESFKGKSPSFILLCHLSLTLAPVYLFRCSTLESQSTKDIVSGYETWITWPRLFDTQYNVTCRELGKNFKPARVSPLH